VLVALAPWLDPGVLAATIHVAPSGDLVAGYAPYLPASLIDAVAADVGALRSEDRRVALVALARRVDGEQRRGLIARALDAALDAASTTVMDAQGWADDLCELLGTLSPQASHALVSTTLETCARGSRLTLVGVVRGLAPELARLGGAPALREAATAVTDVVRWWL
jgi:hypothetical protein